MKKPTNAITITAADTAKASITGMSFIVVPPWRTLAKGRTTLEKTLENSEPCARIGPGKIRQGWNSARAAQGPRSCLVFSRSEACGRAIWLGERCR
jgi:hypothetical protein